ncbi:S-layer homology domain-containing protein [Paenibacillus aceti]|nr:S-layer homology domain-containing protein [Paenibacillus aceti]
MAVMLIRAYSLFIGEELNPAAATPFKDAGEIAPYARSFVDQAVDLGLLKGRGAVEFAPKSALTRAESAQVIVNLLGGLTH